MTGMVPWTLDHDGWLYRNGRTVGYIVTTPEDAGALAEAANCYPGLLAAARTVVEAWEQYSVTGPIPNRPTWRDLDALIDALRAAVEQADG